MGRSLKEALLDQYALLQERGLAPSEVPQEEESPLVVVEAAPRGRQTRGRREAIDRYSDDELGLDAAERERRRMPRREHRFEDGRGGERRRPHTGGARGRGRPEAEPGAPTFAAPERPSVPFRRPMGGGPRPERPGMGAPRPGGPRPIGRTEMLQQRAEQRRRDEEDIAEMRRLLGEFGGQEMDDAAMDTFSRALAEETGALPPPRIVVAAIKQAQTADPRKIGDAVRAYYRRARRATGPAPQRPPQPALAGSPA